MSIWQIAYYHNNGIMTTTALQVHYSPIPPSEKRAPAASPSIMNCPFTRPARMAIGLTLPFASVLYLLSIVTWSAANNIPPLDLSRSDLSLLSRSKWPTHTQRDTHTNTRTLSFSLSLSFFLSLSLCLSSLSLSVSLSFFLTIFLSLSRSPPRLSPSLSWNDRSVSQQLLSLNDLSFPLSSLTPLASNGWCFSNDVIDDTRRKHEVGEIHCRQNHRCRGDVHETW